MQIFGKSEQVQTTGAQLLNLKNGTYTINGVTATIKDGELKLSGTATSNGGRTIQLSEPFLLKQGTYIGSSAKNFDAILSKVLDNSRVATISSGKSFTVNEDIEVYLGINVHETKAYNEAIFIMLNAGESAKPWELYTGDKPSPSIEYPQEIENAGQDGKVEVFGMNICPVSSGTTNFMTYTKVYPGISYSICAKQSIPTALNILIVEENDTYAKNPFEVFNNLQFANGVITFKPTKTGYVYVNSYKVTEYSGVCICAGTVPEYQYESYKEPQILTLRTPGGLSGIPVTSGGNYTDESGQQWVCDEINLEKEERIQRVGKLILTGDEVLISTDTTGTDYQGFALRSENINAKRVKVNILCNYFIRDDSRTKINSITQTTEVYGIRFIVSTDIVPNKTVEEFRAYLKAKYDSGKPVIIQYVLAEPILTPLSPKEIADYKALHTYTPNTTIINDAGCGMSLTYTVDTKKYVDKKIAAISAAMIGG